MIHHRGFTLIEVLVALVIVAAGAAAVLSALNGAATSTVYLRDKTFAQWIAANRIAELRLQRAAPANGTDDGELEYAGSRWQWRQEITEAEIAGLRRIDVSVRPVDSGLAEDEWTASVSGVIGQDVAVATGAEPDWEPAPEAAAPPGGNPNGPPAPEPGSASPPGDAAGDATTPPGGTTPADPAGSGAP